NVTVRRFTIVDFAGFLGEFRSDIFGILLHIFAQPRHELPHLPGLRTGQRLPLAGRHRRRHDGLLDPARIAGRAAELSLARLRVIGRAVLEPALEFVAVLAPQIVDNHALNAPKARPWTNSPRHYGERLSRSRQAEGAVMVEAGDLAPRLLGPFRIDLGSDDTRIRAAFRQDFTPRADNQAVTIGTPAVGVQAALRRGDHEGAILNRPRAKQHMPVRLAGGFGKGGWRGDGKGAFLRQGAI